MKKYRKALTYSTDRRPAGQRDWLKQPYQTWIFWGKKTGFAVFFTRWGFLCMFARRFFSLFLCFCCFLDYFFTTRSSSLYCLHSCSLQALYGDKTWFLLLSWTSFICWPDYWISVRIFGYGKVPQIKKSLPLPDKKVTRKTRFLF